MDLEETRTSGRPEVRLSVLFPIAKYLTEKIGPEALQRAAEAAGVTPNDTIRGKKWVSVEQIDAFLDTAFDIFDHDETIYRKACSYRLVEAYGPLRFVLWALSPNAVLRQAITHFSVVSATGHYELLDEGPTWSKVRFISDRETSRLLCLLRQANAAAMPSFWGLPPATVVEEACLAKGDPACIYRADWQKRQSWWPVVLGIGLGLVLALLFGLIGFGSVPLWVVAPALGAAVGHMYRLSKINRTNLSSAVETQDALQQIAEQEAAARREVVALTQRQAEWTSLMEQQLAERTAALEKVIGTISHLQEKRVAQLKGFSHDLRSPLTVMRCAADMLRYGREQIGGVREDEIVRDLGIAVDKMERILDELMNIVTSENQEVLRSPEEVEIGPFAEQLRRQLRALVHGRDIKTSVFCSREAPRRIETDRLLFDRVVDNLITNAVKYTERGSIVTEIDGIPGYLSLKISDTGRGIAEDEIEQMFFPHGAAQEQRTDHSYGLGLSVVVQLLDDIGGRLEVLSKPGQGTTFWVYFPVSISQARVVRASEPESDDDEERVSRVVTIRRKVTGA